MSWWKPLVLVVLVPLAMVLLNIAFYLVAGLVEGSDDPLSATLTPWKLLAANLSIAASGVLAVVLLVWLTGVPWRRLITLRRRFDRRRLTRYLIASALLMGTAEVVVRVTAPDAAGQAGFAVTTTTIALLAIVVPAHRSRRSVRS